MHAEPTPAFYDDWYRPDNAAVSWSATSTPTTIEDGIVDRFGPTSARGVRSPARPELTVEPSGGTEVGSLSRPRRRRGVRPGDAAAATVADAETDEADYQNGDPRRAGVRHDRHPPRQRCARAATSPFDRRPRGFAAASSGASMHPRSSSSADGDVARGVDAGGRSTSTSESAGSGSSQAEVDRASRRAATAADSRTTTGASHVRTPTSPTSTSATSLDRRTVPRPPTRSSTSSNAVLDRATPETVAYRFVQRLAEAPPHVLVVGPGQTRPTTCPPPQRSRRRRPRSRDRDRSRSRRRRRYRRRADGGA